MGSPISPALAVIVCAYYENKIFKAVNDWGWANTNTIMGTRYMDDVLAFVTHDGSDISGYTADSSSCSRSTYDSFLALQA